MCGGILGDVGSFVKDTAGEIVDHPGKSLGTLFGVPGYDPFFGGLFNSKNTLVGPTGDFTGSTWNQMAQANPQDNGILNTMQSVNGVADQIAPAIAGGFALGGVGGLGSASEAAGASATSTPEDLMAAYTSGAEAGTGGALGTAGGAGAGDLSGFGSDMGSGAPMGFGGGSSGDISGALGGVSGGSGAATPTASLTDPMSGGTLGNGIAPQAATPDAQGSLSSLYGPNSTASGAPMGQAIDSSTGGVNMEGSQLGSTFAQPSSGQMMGAAAGEGTPATWAGGNSSMQGLQDIYNQVSPWVSGAKDIMSGLQQYKQMNQQKGYLNSINQMYAPNSPYAQQMQQTLARTDAAAGRNSQYGNRAVQLAAALTNDRTRALTSPSYYGANNAAGAGNTNVLNGLFNDFGQAASNPAVRSGINSLGSSALNSLGSLFSGW